MKIFSAQQIRDLDAYSIKNEPIASIDLMERAARACTQKITELLHPADEVFIFCGMGNNGGDGLAIARMLQENNFKCRVFVIRFREEFSVDAGQNYERLKKKFPATLIEIENLNGLPEINAGSRMVAIDAILGSGVSEKKSSLVDSCIDYINTRFTRVVSIDLPSGLMPDGEQQGQKIVASSLTLTFQMPRLAFLLPENAAFVQEFQVLDIGLDTGAIEHTPTDKYFVTADDILPLLRRRKKFSHKGTYGHALLLAGSRGKTGAALLAAEAALRSGAGLLTVHSTEDTLRALAIRLPEAMGIEDDHSEMITQVEHPENYEALAFGPGTGTEEDTPLVLKKILQHSTRKLVIDADGLNILSENKTWLEFLPPATILTPHPLEFERLAGKSDDDMHRLQLLRNFSMRFNAIVVLKGAFTCIAMPDGNLFFNSTGNPCLAKGGSGDALTGVILGLLSSGYNAPQAALIGVFVHGLAADICASTMGLEAVLSTDVITRLPSAFKMLHDKKQNKRQ